MWQPWLAFAALTVLNVVDRLPHFLNAKGVHSDAAIVGLQAMHLLRGEHSRFLWGAGYQGSFDAMIVAAFFAAFGPTPLSLMAAPFLGHLVLCACMYSMFQRRLDAPWLALLLCLPLVFTPAAINGVVLYVPRQWSITFVFVGLWLFEGGQRLRPLRFFVGAFVAWLATFLDLYALLLLAPAMIFLVLCAFDEPRSRTGVGARLVSGILGAAAGHWAVGWLRDAPGASSQQAGLVFTLDQVRHNWQLFSETCLPWVLGARVWIPGRQLYPELWQPPHIIRVLQWLGGFSLLAFIVLAPCFVRSRRVTWPIQRLGWLGAIGAAATCSGFLVSTMPEDMWATRYLAPVVWFAPCALAPWAAWSTRRYLGLLLLPYLTCAAVGGWLAYGNYVDGAWPRRDPRGTAKQEQRLGRSLRARGIKVAYAQYWLSYRLTFLWHENPVVLPFAGDRYAEYGRALNAERTAAYIFHPSEPRAKPEDVRPSLKTGTVESEEIEGFTVLIHHR